MWPFSSRTKEKRSSNWFTAFTDLVTPVAAGVAVTQTTAVELPAVYRCVTLNAETISSLPLDVFVKRGESRVPYRDVPGWIRQPNDLRTMPQFLAESQVSLDLDGNCFWLKAVDGTGRVVGLTVLPPESVAPKLVRYGADPVIVYDVDVTGGKKRYAATEIVHLRGLTMPGELRGLSPISCARQTIGVGLAAERFGAHFFGNGATLSGVIEADGSMNEEQAERIMHAFSKRHGGVSKSHLIAVLSGGATFKPLEVKPEEAQFLESRRYTATEIANLFGCPPELVADIEGAKGYVTGLHTRLRMWYITGLLPRLTRIEAALSDMLPRPAYVKFNVNGLLRMDPAERIAFYQAAQLGEWMTRNEIRALEDMNPLPGGDEPLHSVQWQENAPPDDGATDDGDEAAEAAFSMEGDKT